MKIPKKSKFNQLFCKHNFVEGVLRDKKNNPLGFYNIQGDTITIMCKKCGKIERTYFCEN